MEERRVYLTKFKFIEDLDPRSYLHCMQCGFCTEGFAMSMPTVKTSTVSCPLEGVEAIPGFEPVCPGERCKL